MWIGSFSLGDCDLRLQLNGEYNVVVVVQEAGPAAALKQVEELEEEALKEFEEYCALGKLVLKNMGLLSESQDTGA